MDMDEATKRIERIVKNVERGIIANGVMPIVDIILQVNAEPGTIVTESDIVAATKSAEAILAGEPISFPFFQR